MVINPFRENNKSMEQRTFDSSVNNFNKNINVLDVDTIQRYITDNYLEFVKKEDKEAIEKKIDEYIFNTNKINDTKKIEEIKIKVIDKMFGYHILQKYIENDEITDIRAVSYNNIYVKRLGIWEKTNEHFVNKKEFNEYVRYCVLKNGGNINYETPIIVISDKKYNLRIEAGIFPVNAISPSIVIRIHRYNQDVNLETLFVKDGMIDGDIYTFLLNAINLRKNIILSGKGGSGKTTLLKAIIDKIPDEVAITTNEETIELSFSNKNIIQREILLNRDETKKVNLEKLTRHSLVMSNDVIVIGELKGEETAVFFDSISTGHMGLATVHSDSAKNTVDRLVTLVKRDIKAQQYKEEFVKKMLVSSIDYIIFLNDYLVVEIIQVVYDDIENKIEYISLFKFEKINHSNEKHIGMHIYCNDKNLRKKGEKTC